MKKIFLISGHVVLALAAIAGFGAAVMWLWNALVPDIFGLPALHFWQALGLLALCRILFGNGGMKHHRRHNGKHHAHNHLREKWMRMSPEERTEFISHRHFGHGFCNHENPEK